MLFFEAFVCDRITSYIFRKLQHAILRYCRAKYLLAKKKQRSGFSTTRELEAKNRSVYPNWNTNVIPSY